MPPSKVINCFILIVITLLRCDISYCVTVEELIDDLTSEISDRLQLSNDTTTTGPGDDHGMLDEEILKALDDVAKELVREISRSGDEYDDDLASDQSAMRSRRSEMSPNSPVVHGFQGQNEDGINRLRGIMPSMSMCDHPIGFSITGYNGITIGVCINVKMPEIVIGEVSLASSSFVPKIRLQTIKNPTSSASFVDKDRLFVMVADSLRSDGIDLHVITKSYAIKSEHITSCRFPTNLNIWKPNSDGPYHLAVANSPGQASVGQTNSWRDKTTFYKWTGTYFDSYTSVDSFHVKDICPFSVAGKDYVVIINHESSPGTFNVDSELFKFDPDDLKWKSIQKIKTIGALDCEVFSLGPDNNQEFFLAIANNRELSKDTKLINHNLKSVIYKFGNDKFVPFQCIPTIGATAIKAFAKSSETSSSFVLAIAHAPGLELYQYNGWKFMRSPVQLVRGATGPGIRSLTFAVVNAVPVLVVANPRMTTREPNVLKLDFVHESDLKNWKKASFEWCSSVQSQMADQKSSIKRLEHLLNGTFATDQMEPIRIRGNVIATNVNVSVNGFLRAPSVHDSSARTILSHQMVSDLEALNKQLAQLEQEISSITNSLNHALQLEGNQVVTGPFKFSNVDFVCANSERCVTNAMNAQTINGADVSKLNLQVLRTDRDQIVSDDVTMSNIQITGDVIVDGSINGIDTSRVILRSANQVVPSPKEFSSHVNAGRVSVLGLINGIKIDNNTILTKSGNQLVTSSINFSSGPVSANNLNVQDVNSIVLNDLLSDLVTTDGDYVIRGQKNLTSIAVRGLNLLPGAKISGVDVLELWNNVLWTQGDQNVRSPINFTDVDVSNDFRSEKSINKMVFPNPDMVLTNERSKVITGAKVFDTPVTTVDHAIVGHSINGVKKLNSIGFSAWPNQLDILVKNLAQTFPEFRTFSSNVHLGGHSSVQGDVDTVDLSNFSKLVLKRNGTNFLAGNWNLTGDTRFRNKVSISGFVDGVNLTDIYTRSLKLSDAVIPNFAPFHFMSLSTPSIKTRTVNRLILDRDLLTKNTRQVVTGIKTFPAGISIGRNVSIMGVLNGNIDVKFMADSLVKSGSQTVWGDKVIQGDLYVNNLITSNVNGINLNDLVFLNSTSVQVLNSGKKTFNSIQVNGNLDVTRMMIEKEINGIRVQELLKGTMMFDEPQVVTGLKHFSRVLIPEKSDLTCSSVNGYNLRNVWLDAVLIDVPQTISGIKTFKSSKTSFEQLFFHRTLDTITDHDMRYNWMLQGVNQFVDGSLTFNAGLSLGSNLGIANGTINGIDIVKLNRTIVKKHEPASISGPVTFTRNFAIGGDVTVRGSIQGIKLSRDALTRNEDAIIHGVKKLASNVSVEEVLNVHGLLNGILVPALCSNAVRNVGNQIIRSRTIVHGDVSTSSSLYADGRIDGINLLNYNSTAVKINEPSVIFGRKRFLSNLILMSPLTIHGTLGSLSLSRLASDYMSLSRDQVINSPIDFNYGVKFQSLDLDGSLFVKHGLINNVSLRTLDRTSLKVVGNQIVTAPLIFNGPVRVRGDLKFLRPRSIINGISISSLVLKTRTQNVIKTSVAFTSGLEIRRNLILEPSKAIQGVDLSQVANLAVRKTGSTTIDGPKRFAILEIDDLIVSGTISGLNITPNHVLLASANQIINGNVHFGSGVRFLSNLNANLINNVDLNTWSRRLVLNGFNNSINSQKVFGSKVSINNAWVLGSIDGVQLSQLRNSIYEKVDVDHLQKSISFLDTKLAKLDSVLTSRAMTLDHFATFRTFPSESLIPVFEFGVKNHFLTKDRRNSCSKVNVYSTIGLQPSFVTSFKSWNPVLAAIVNLNGREITIVSTARVHDVAQVGACIQSSPQTMRTGSSVLQVMVRHHNSSSIRLANVICGDMVTDLKILSHVRNRVCFLAAVPFKVSSRSSAIESSSPVVLCLDADGQVVSNTSLTQSLAASSLDVHVGLTATFVAAASSRTSFVNILSWDPVTRTSSKIQDIHVNSPTSVKFVTTSTIDGSQVFLMAADSKVLRVFKFVPSSKMFLEVQQVPQSFEIVAIDSVLLPDHSLVIFTLLSDGRVSLLTYKGASGFERMMTKLPKSDFNSISVIPKFLNNKLTGHFVAVGHKSKSLFEENDVLESGATLFSSVFIY